MPRANPPTPLDLEQTGGRGVEKIATATAEDPTTVATRSATPSEIVAIVGHLDDGVIARILASGATPAEVLEAFTWAHADDQLGRELLRRPHGARAVFDILMREEPDPEELR